MPDHPMPIRGTVEAICMRCFAPYTHRLQTSRCWRCSGGRIRWLLEWMRPEEYAALTDEQRQNLRTRRIAA